MEIKKKYAILNEDYYDLFKNTFIEVIKPDENASINRLCIVKPIYYTASPPIDKGCLHDCDGKMPDTYYYYVDEDFFDYVDEDHVFSDIINKEKMKNEFIGKYAITTKRRSNLPKGVLVYIDNSKVSSLTDYAVTPIEHKEQPVYNKTVLHKCDYHFKEDIGYYVAVDEFEVISDEEANRLRGIIEEETLEEDFGNVWN